MNSCKWRRAKKKKEEGWAGWGHSSRALRLPTMHLNNNRCLSLLSNLRWVDECGLHLRWAVGFLWGRGGRSWRGGVTQVEYFLRHSAYWLRSSLPIAAEAELVGAREKGAGLAGLTGWLARCWFSAPRTAPHLLFASTAGRKEEARHRDTHRGRPS